MFAEPLLLVGETGTGKTSTIQHLASLLSRPLVVLNLSNQTEAGDLLGGFKPVDARVPAATLQEAFLRLFGGTFSLKRNAEYGDAVRKAVQGGKWKRVVKLWRDAMDKAVARIRESIQEGELDSNAPRKRRKVEGPIEALSVTEAEWAQFEKDVALFEAQHILAKSKFAFSFVEGPLVRALRAGHWVLLDEINLASSETLEAITPLLQSPTSSLTLTEQGSLEPVPRHPSFRLFASMNPATDVGKKDLPPNLRLNFTEIWVPPPDTVREALLSIVEQYIGRSCLSDRAAILDVAEFYEAVRKLAESRLISDGSNHRPHFSMRTLTRALTFASDVAPVFGLRRALWEGCLMCFTMTLDTPSADLVRPLAEKHLLSGVKNKRALLSQVPKMPPGSAEDHVQVGQFSIKRGPLPLESMDEYILTPSVQTKLIDLARVVLTRRSPVLIEGPTSAGKTSAIEYLARRTGHRFVRINNHEHTDIQEYIGTYVSDPNTGKLIFQDGILVRALRRGDWIVLDELNLAPTDVLEALNRLLDDNRELLIPETQEVVRPHESFMLFATQNPPGLYAGRKVLSRAFRNRFLEIHFGDVPQVELETILCQRCRIAPSYGQRIVAVFRELQQRRQAGRVFETKQSFATLRDLFRWAGRDAVGYQELAENGYMLLAERARRADDKAVVKEVIENVMKVRIDEKTLYLLDRPGVDISQKLRLPTPLPSSSDLVWTNALFRLFSLVATAVRYREPVLLVGDTGSGKTSVCQFLAEALGKDLYSISCHQNTETADLLGGQRPIRNRSALRTAACTQAAVDLASLGLPLADPQPTDVEGYISLVDQALLDKSHSAPAIQTLRRIRSSLQRTDSLFEWHDGPLIQAMQGGSLILLDEISLADDSVLERLNSVLEPSRTLVLAEKGGWDVEQVQITAHPEFALISTMNPGGDYGKKELSPALRNRFTEIWVPPVEDRADRKKIIDSTWQHPTLATFSEPLLDFSEWIGAIIGDPSVMGLRDILAWVTFSNRAINDATDLTPVSIFHHSAHMTILDGLSSLSQTSSLSRAAIADLRQLAVAKLHDLAPLSIPEAAAMTHMDVAYFQGRFLIGPFGVTVGERDGHHAGFSLEARTTRNNAMRVLRACQLRKPILLEGSPGVGKTSLITALANASGHNLCRVNLSDQTDIMDLFGSDLPVEGGKPGEFQWKDAAFLRALQNGDWVLLDEMNLAPQAVLEGLNAVLDHRGTVYIPELNRTFIRHPNFRIFAAQNPLQQGGGRKGLPKSFLNRFTKVYIQELDANDLLLICRDAFPDHPEESLRSIITFTARIQDETMLQKSFGRDGGPWEFNLRDLLRWLALLSTPSGLEVSSNPLEQLDTIFIQRFRTAEDRSRVRAIYHEVFGEHPSSNRPWPSITPNHVQIGHNLVPSHHAPSRSRTHLLQSQLSTLQAATSCIQHGWLVIIAGGSGVGKNSVSRTLAEMCGVQLHEFPMSSSIDTTDLLGGFEQVSVIDRARILARKLLRHIDENSRIWTRCHKWIPESALESLRLAIGRPVQSGSSPSLLLEETRTVCERLALVGDSSRFLDELNSLVVHESTGRFDWVDGPLISAMQSGHWLLLDNSNLCSPAVLDRLNSLCEVDGLLTLSERGVVNGEVQVIRPHPDFRLIMTLDPRHGELSRAMRNRGLELYLFPISEPEDLLRINQPLSTPEEVQSFRNQDLLSISSQLSRRGLRVQSTRIEVPTNTQHFPFDISHRDQGARIIGQSTEVLRPFVSSLDHLEACVLHLLRTSSLKDWRRSLRSLSIVFANSPHDIKENAATRLNELFSSSIFTSGARRTVTRIRGSLLTFLLSQPLDLRVNPNLSLSPKTDELYTTSRVFELAVRLKMLGEELRDVPRLSLLETSLILHQGRPIVGDVHPAVPHLAPLIINIRAFAKDTITRWMTGDLLTEGAAALVRTATALIEFSEHLREAVGQALFDFTVIRLVVNWLCEALESSPTEFGNIKTLLEALASATAITSGHGMREIWSALLPVNVSTEDLRMIKSLATSCYRLNIDGTQETLRLRAHSIELGALLSLGAEVAPMQQQQMTKLIMELNDKIDSSGQNEPQVEQQEDSLLLHAAELGVLASISTRPSDAVKEGQFVLDRAYQAPGYYFARLSPLQKLIWNVDAKDTTLGMHSDKAACHIQWLKSIWTLQAPEANILDGPSMLLKPVGLLTADARSQWKASSLHGMNDYAAGLSRQLAFIVEECRQHPQPRLNQLNSLLAETLSIILHPFKTSYAEPTFERIIQELRGGSVLDLPSAEFSSLLVATENTFLRDSLRQHFLPLISSSYIDLNDQLARTGEKFVGLSLIVLELYVPNVPLDPVVSQRSTSHYHLVSVTRLQTHIDVVSRMEALTTGNLANPILEDLKSRLFDAESRLGRSAGSSIIREPNIARLHAVYTEISQFNEHALGSGKIEALLADLRADPSDLCLAREKVVQDSISGFVQRLEHAYEDVADITMPYIWSLAQLRLGLRLAAHASQLRHTKPTGNMEPIIESLVSFPSINAARLSRDIHPPTSSSGGQITAADWTVHVLAGIAYEVKAGGLLEHCVDKIESLYDQLLFLWMRDVEKEKQDAKEANSLYRQHKHEEVIVSDEVAEEAEFQQMFPGFHGEEGPSTPAPHNPSQAKSVQTAHLIDLARLHNSMFGGSSSAPPRATYRNRRTAILHSLSIDRLSLTDQLDQRSVYWRLHLIADCVSELQNPSSEINIPNFYVDSNIPEIRKAVFLLGQLRSRLDVLVEEWPDQMVLQHLRERCQVILTVNMGSSVAKVLSALEGLLPHMTDWETYSNRDNSLKSHQGAITNLIVEWRRLELAGWANLLESQAQAFNDGASNWWFTLYESTIRGTLAASGDQVLLDEHLLQLTPLIDQYMLSSPLGQYCVRLDLLRSFANYATMISPSKPGPLGDALARVANLLHSLVTHYHLPLPFLLTELGRRRAILEKEIKDYIKMASWKDVNVYALKQSAERTHRHLHRCIRKFRDILRDPVTPYLVRRDDIDLAKSSVILYPDPPLQELSELPLASIEITHSPIDLPTALAKFKGFLENSVRNSFARDPSISIDMFAVQILTTTQELSATSVGGTPEVKAKANKALITRKRRALLDMVKELKRIGFSSSIKPEVLRMHESRSALMEVHVGNMALNTPVASSMAKTESYYHRLIDEMQGMRDAMRSHHSDISTRDLQRAMLFTESAFSHGLTARSLLRKVAGSHQHLSAVSARFRSLSSEHSRYLVRLDDAVPTEVDRLATDMAHLVDAFEEIITGCTRGDIWSTEASPLSPSPVNKIQDHLRVGVALRDDLLRVRAQVRLTKVGFLLHPEMITLEKGHAHIRACQELLHSCVIDEPRLRHLCHPVAIWLKSAMVLSSPFATPHIHQDLRATLSSEEVISPLLVVTQELVAWSRAVQESDGEDDTHFVRRKTRACVDFIRFSHIELLDDKMDKFIRGLCHQPPSGDGSEMFSQHERLIAQVRPFLELFVDMLGAFIADLAEWNKALFKLSHIVCSTVCTLAERGFCKPPDADETGSGAEGGQTMEGTGLGEGSGAEDVSKEIEDESQVEGLQGEDSNPQDEKEKDQDKPDDGIEMSQDFDGRMEDVDQDNDDGDDDDDDGGSEPDPEDQIGDVDPTDPNAVDEKMWGDEEPPEKKPDGSTEEDRSTKKTSENSEIVAKEGDEQKEKKQDKEAEQGGDEPIQTEDDENGDEEEEGPNMDNSHPDLGAKLDDHVQDANTLDLPDDLDMGPEGDDVDEQPEDQADGPDEDMPIDDLITEQPESSPAKEPEVQEADKHEPGGAEEDAESTNPEEPDAEAAIEAAGIMDEEMVNEEEDNQTNGDEPPRSKQEAAAGLEGDEGADDSAGQARNEGATDGGEGDQAMQNGVVSDAPTSRKDDDQEQSNPSLSENVPTNQPLGPESGDGQQGTASAPSGGSKSRNELPPISNPLRSLGDALKDIRRRFDDILDQEEDSALQPKPNVGADLETPDAAEVEYLRPDDEDEDMQALGPSGQDEEASKLQDLRITDDDDGTGDMPPVSEDVEMEGPPLDQADSRPLLHDKSTQYTDGDEDLEAAVTKAQIRDISLREDGLDLPIDDDDDADSVKQPPRAESEPPIPPADEQVEIRLRDWQSSGQPDAQAHELWRLYESLTHDLAYTLCEQLRLILEPTLATRLKGDYRTGKRLNMKKIIPYIASEYTKDKIWLRRTRPSKREYQVMIALDDSKSMREGRSGHLAFETLALVVKALGRLEAGDVGVVKFGETIDVLHDFESGNGAGFTDEDGARVMRSFKFDQRATDVLSLVERSLTVLSEARERRGSGSSSAADLWQLEIIISDGICQNHDKLRTALRKAAEQRVMIVFVIVDALRQTAPTPSSTLPLSTPVPTAQNSILSMNQATYTMVNGKMELQMQRYLDTFPFEYYVVLRNVEALPDVLSGTLKQFFERISED